MTRLWVSAILLILIVSCTLVVPKSSDLRDIKEISQNISCEKPAKIQLFSSQKVINDNFYEFYSSDNPFNQTSLISAWMLIQMNYRPDLTSENSQFLATIIKGSKTYVFDSYTNNHNYLNFIAYFNLRFNGSHSLGQIAKIINKDHPKNFRISGDFSQYLKKNLKFIKKSKILSAHFLRGSEYLRENERLKPLNFSHITKRAKDLKFKQTKLKKSGELYCNTSQFKTIRSSSLSNSFSIKIGNFIVMMSTSQINQFSPGPNFFLKTSMSKFPKTLCYFNNKISAWLISDQGRSPYQHLNHLAQFNIHQSMDKKELEEYLNFSRHLILKNPIRLIYESNRGSRDQLDKLLKFDIPIYYSGNLGNIFGVAKDRHSYLLKDNRVASEIKCNN